MTRLSVSSDELREQLLKALAFNNCSDLCLHTDIRSVGIPGELIGANSIADNWLALVEQVAKDKLIRFPTFNYNYCQTGIYDVQQDISTVGFLNELVRQKYPERRTRTPVFNFSSLGNHLHQRTKELPNPFGKLSTFDEIFHNNGWIAYLGAKFSSTTFIHYVEEAMNIGYRYYKLFPGIIKQNEEKTTIEFIFRVRPPGNIISYDWEKLETELLSAGLLLKYTAGLGAFMLINSKKLFDHWSRCMELDPFYLLTQPSRIAVIHLSKKYSYPFEYKELEPSSRGR